MKLGTIVRIVSRREIDKDRAQQTDTETKTKTKTKTKITTI